MTQSIPPNRLGAGASGDPSGPGSQASPQAPTGLGHPVSIPIAPCDKTGRSILVGDILKVFHFTGRRNKRYFMYKQVARIDTLGRGENRSDYYFVSHLNQTDEGYYLALNGKALTGYEIVQSVDSVFQDRPRNRELVAVAEAENAARRAEYNQ